MLLFIKHHLPSFFSFHLFQCLSLSFFVAFISRSLSPFRFYFIVSCILFFLAFFRFFFFLFSFFPFSFLHFLFFLPFSLIALFLSFLYFIHSVFLSLSFFRLFDCSSFFLQNFTKTFPYF